MVFDLLKVQLAEVVSLVQGAPANIPKIVSDTQWNCQFHVYTSYLYSYRPWMLG